MRKPVVTISIFLSILIAIYISWLAFSGFNTTVQSNSMPVSGKPITQPALTPLDVPVNLDSDLTTAKNFADPAWISFCLQSYISEEQILILTQGEEPDDEVEAVIDPCFQYFLIPEPEPSSLKAEGGEPLSQPKLSGALLDHLSKFLLLVE